MFILYITSRYSHFNILLANLAKGNMSFCHHLVSVICHLFTFHIFSSENPQPNELKLGWKHLWKVLFKECTFCYDPLPNMSATGNSCFRFFKIFSSETAWSNKPNLVGSIYEYCSVRPDRLGNMSTTETW